MENENNSPKAEATPMLTPGTMLQGGKYRIEKVLGQGGFGITYLATMMMLNQKVAIKEFFFKEFCERNSSDSTVLVTTHAKKDLVERFQQKFLKEANIIFGLRHENIIKLLDVFQENDTSYYAMEYVEGKSLSEEVKAHGPMSTADALEVMKCMCGALGCIHSRKINHLDIKPQNIMLDEREHRVVLIDFGVSKQYDPSTGDCNTTTPVGVSEGYSPLEQYNQGGVNSFSPQSDIYSLGATLYKIITGKTPPTAIDVSQNGLPSFPDNVPGFIAEAIKKAMQPARTQRPQTVEEFWALLNVQPQVEEEEDDDEDQDTCFIDPSAPPVPPVNNAKPAPAQKSAPAAAPAQKPAAAPASRPAASSAAPAAPAKKHTMRNILIGVLAGLGLVFVSLFVIGMFLDDSSTTGEDATEFVDNPGGNEIADLVAELNSYCPVEMDQGVMMQEVTYKDGVVEYVMELDDNMHEFSDYSNNVEVVKEETIAGLLESTESDELYDAVLANNGAFRYVYVSKSSGDSFYFEIDASELQ